jgi:vancomycin permeability regulator SanA
VPLSTFIAALLFLCAWLAKPETKIESARGTRFVFCTGLSVVAFAFLQMLFFGTTDYRRRADAIVVFGARTYADGRMSDALRDRVRTACELYRQNFASKLIFSGGPGDGPIHETEAMCTYALRVGVAPQDIILDRAGLNTRATVENTKSILAQHQLKSLLCVSHFYHLPRVKLTYQRAGIPAYTVPAKETQFLARLPLFMARECAALLKYYFTMPGTDLNRRA